MQPLLRPWWMALTWRCLEESFGTWFVGGVVRSSDWKLLQQLPVVLLLGICLLGNGCGGGAAPIANSDPAPRRSDPFDTPQFEPLAATSDRDAARHSSGEAESGLRQELADAIEETAQPPAPVYRPDDARMHPQAEKLDRLEIARYESRHLVLYTDIEPETARSLLPVGDQAYEALVRYFGELPPARDGSEFQMHGYLIRDADRFIAAGLIPEEVLQFDHGQHRGQEFWMYEQEFDYYRRHLLIHEITHCFMLILPGLHPPLWYLEGMAEYFATHRVLDSDEIEFGVMPDHPEAFVGFSRIEMLQQEIAAGRLLSLDQVTALGANEFSKSRSIPYAWSWAFCLFLDAHPRYQERFRHLGEHLVGEEFYRLLRSNFQNERTLVAAEWDQFVRGITYNWDFAAHAFRESESPLQPLLTRSTLEVKADVGWQSSGYQVFAGQTYRVAATGQISLADEPRPWISEPQGVTIRYAAGRPIGRLLAGVVPEAGELTPASGSKPQAAMELFDCGPETTFTPQRSGTLYFQINDFGNDRHNNRGAFQVTVQPLDAS